MITIHHEKETDFSKNGYGAIDDYVMSQEVTWEMNGQFYVYLEYPAFLDKSVYLVNKNILRVPVPFMEDQLFRIYRVRKVLGFIQVEARHIFYDLMDNLIEDTNIVGKTGSQAIQQLLGATQYEHRFIGFSDISTSNNARMVRYNPVEALLDDSKANTFVSRWGGEVVRDNFVIRMVRQMGTDRGVRIQHRKDLTEYIATIDESTVVTRIMPVGFDGLKLPELYIDSPLLDPDNPKIEVIRYENVKAAIGEYADDNGAVPLEEAYELLREHARAEFSANHLDEPEMTVTVNFVTLHNTKEYADFAQLQEIHQGDVVRVSVPDEDFEVTSRLVAFTSDPLQQNHYTSTTLGNHVYEFTSSTNSVSTLRNEVEALRESVVEVRQSANGKNQNFWGEADPNTLNLNAILGDTYFRSVGEEDVIYQYVEVDGERYWKEIINTANTTEVKKEVERVAEEAEKLADDITEAQQSADDAKRDAGLALTASEALEIITQETASQLSDTRGLLATVESNASEALSQAGQATIDAQTAMGNAQTALSKANDTESTVSTLSSEFDEVAGKVELKADKSEVDTISGTVSSHTTTLSQHATAISSKAEQSEVDTISGTVSTNTSTLSQHAKDISARLTQTQVDNLVSGKGYSTISYVDTQMSATAEGIRTEMTAVEGKIPTEIGGTNLVPDSDLINHSRGITVWLHATFKPSSEGLEVKSTASSGTYGIRTQSFNVIGGQDYIISADIGSYYSVHFLDYIYIMYEDGLANQRLDVLPIDGSTITLRRYGLKFKASRTGRVNILFGKVIGYSGEGFRIRNIKLEKGSIQSDWSPAPVDSLSNNDFTAFKNTYSSTITGITSELNKTAKKTDLNGMVTESYLATNQYTKQGEINTQLQSYLKTTDLEGKVQQTTAFQNVKTATDRFTRVIGSTDSEAKDNIAQIAMTDSSFQTTVRDSVDVGGTNIVRNTDISVDDNISEATPRSAGTAVARNLPSDYPQYFIYAGAQNQAVGYTVGFEFGKSTGFRIEKDQVYTLSFLSLYSGSVYLPYDYMYVMRNVGNNQQIFTGTQDYEIVEVGTAYTTFKVYKHTYTFKANWSEPKAWLLIASRAKIVDPYQWIRVAQIQLEKGNVATDWSPSPLDMATTQQVSDIKQTADSIQALVGTSNESVARAVMTSNLWETEVSKVIDGELEQEYETVLSPVNVVNGKDSNSGEAFSGGKRFYYTYDVAVELSMLTGVDHVFELTMPATQNKGQLVELETRAFGSTEWVNTGVSFNLPTGQYKVVHNFTSTTFATSVADYRLVLHNGGNSPVTSIYTLRVYKNEEVQVPIIGEETGAISSKITQLYDMINLSVLGKEGALSRIAIGEEGIELKSDLIHLDGKVKMTEAFAQKLFAEEVSADTVTAFSAKFANAIVGNLDVNNIGGNKASFIQLLLNGTNTALRATSSVVDIMRNDGSISTRLTQNGMEIWRDGSKVGDFESRSSISESGALANKKSISMTPERDSYISLGYYKSGETKSTRVLSVAGDTGRLYLSSPIYPSESSTYGLQIQRYTLNSSGGIRVGSTGGSSGIFFGDFGHVSVQFNGTWYSMDRLIN